MSEQIALQAYLASLPEVETARLPIYTLFAANQRIYQVVEIGAGGFHKGREWRKGEDTDIALVSGSLLANFLPVVLRGRLLPIYPSREDLLERSEPLSYLFPDERQALDVAYLDAALVRSGDVYVRNHGRKPAFALTDGVRVFRTYYYSRSIYGHAIADSDIATAKTIQFRPFARGPMYWRMLSSWPQATFWGDEDTLPHYPSSSS